MFFCLFASSIGWKWAKNIHIHSFPPSCFSMIFFNCRQQQMCCPPPGACWVNNNHKHVWGLDQNYCGIIVFAAASKPWQRLVVIVCVGFWVMCRDKRALKPFSGDKRTYHLTVTCFPFRNKQNAHHSQPCLSCDNIFMILALRSEKPHHLPSTQNHNCLLHPCRWDAGIAANVNAAQLVLKARTARKAHQPVGRRETYYNSDRRLDIFVALCHWEECTLEMSR